MRDGGHSIIPAGQQCEHGSGLFRRACGRAAMGECVYCARAFCVDHGTRGEEFIEVCMRPTCRTKAQDVLRHQEWRRTHAEANRAARCAHDQCEERMRHECSQCRLSFCEAHVHERAVTSHLTTPAQRVLVVMCAHCTARRRLWD